MSTIYHNFSLQLSVLCLTSVPFRQRQLENISKSPLEVNNAVLLNHVYKHHKMLLVYDGANDLSFLHKVLPRSTARVHVLITSRCDDCSALHQVSHVFSLGCLEDEDAVSALSKWSGRQPSSSQETAAITKLSIEPPIEKLPIALAHAGTYVRKARLSYDEYYKLLKTEKVRLEALALDLNKLLHYFNASCLHEELLLARLSQPADLKLLTDMEIDGLNMRERDKGVVKIMRNFLSSSHVHLTWQMDIDLVEKENPKALSFLEYASFLSSSDIPENLVRPLVFSDSAKYEYSLCVSALSSHNLVEFHEPGTSEGYSLNIHPLVQSTVLERVQQKPSEAERKLTDLCRHLLAQLFDHDKNGVLISTNCVSSLPISHFYSLARHVLLTRVETERCLHLIWSACCFSWVWQSPQIARSLIEKFYAFASQLHSQSDEIRRIYLIEGITAIFYIDVNIFLFVLF